MGLEYISCQRQRLCHPLHTPRFLYKAKGKRLSTREIESFSWLEPIEPETPEEDPTDSDDAPESDENVAVNPADVPLEIEDTTDESRKSGDGIQMELF